MTGGDDPGLPRDRSLQEGVAVNGSPFGDQSKAEVQYQTMYWWHAGALMCAETISLGILGLPHVMKTLGLFWGVFSILAFGFLATYTGYVYGQMGIGRPKVASVGDAAGAIFGRWASEIVGASSTLVLLFIMAAHISTFSIAMNVLINHATCSIIFGVVGTVISIICTLPRRLEDMKWFSVASCVSICSAVILTMIGAAVADKPTDLKIEIFAKPSFLEAMIALLDIILAFAGHVCYFNFIAELKQPRDFTKSLFMMQSITITFYILTAVVIYCYAGNHVMSPALGSAPPLLRKIAYGVAMPTIIIAGVVNGHIAVKSIWLRIWDKDRSVCGEKSWRSRGSWVGLVIGSYLVAWLIAEAIPSFKLLLALISALFMGWFSYGFSGFFWLYLNQTTWRSSKRKLFLTVLNVLVIIIGVLISTVGLYASIKNLSMGAGGKSFACEDNSTPEAQGQ